MRVVSWPKELSTVPSISKKIILSPLYPSLEGMYVTLLYYIFRVSVDDRLEE